MSKSIYSSNLTDRTFALFGHTLAERRWTGTQWTWVVHAAISAELAQLSQGGLGLGVFLANTEQGVGCLYIQRWSEWNGNNSLSNSGPMWLLYRFRLDRNDYSNPSSFEHPDYSWLKLVPGISTKGGLSVSSSWNLYGVVDTTEVDITTVVSASPGDDGSWTAAIAKFDPFLKMKAAAKAPGQGGLLRQGAHPAVLSDQDVFFVSAVPTPLFHVNIGMGRSRHDRKMWEDVSDGFDDGVFVIKSGARAKLEQRVFRNGKWKWDDHGRPAARRHISEHVEGSLRRLDSTHAALVYIVKTKFRRPGPQRRIYQRWVDGGGHWHWADHGYPSSELLTEIGVAWHGTFFVMTDSGNLWQRHWREGDNRWAWDLHGQP